MVPHTHQGGMKRLIGYIMRLSGESMAGHLTSELQEGFIAVRVRAWLSDVFVPGQDFFAWFVLPRRCQGRELKGVRARQPSVALVNTHGPLWVSIPSESEAPKGFMPTAAHTWPSALGWGPVFLPRSAPGQ